MSDSVIRQLADQLLDLTPDPAQMVRPVWGKVTFINTGPASVNIRIQGSATAVSGVRYAAGYSPTVGDTVYGRIMGTDILIEGKLAL